MKYEKMITIITLPIMWFAYCLFELITGRMNEPSVITGNIILILLFALVGYIIYYTSLKYPNGLSSYSFLLVFILLIAVDQGVKIIIKSLFFNTHKAIISDFLYFYPIINTDGSWLNARFNTGLNFAFLIFLNFIALFLFAELYRYYLYKKGKNKSFFEDTCFLFIFCGAFCSLLDKLFYGGSLDFIGIGNLFIADLKDIYINLGLLLFFVSMYRNGLFSSNDSSSLKDDINSVKKFLVFVKKDIIRK